MPQAFPDKTAQLNAKLRFLNLLNPLVVVVDAFHVTIIFSLKTSSKKFYHITKSEILIVYSIYSHQHHVCNYECV